MADLTLANSTYSTGTNDTASTLVNNVSSVDAQQYNGVATACVGIETILGTGTTLKGNLADLVARLAVQMDANGIVIPIGAIEMYAGSSAPTGWLLCDGSAVSRTTYANLFSVISTTYGAGNGTTTFNVPDLRGRVPIGVGTGTGGGSSGTGAPTGGSALTAVSRATWKGAETHTLTSSEMPVHSHTLTDPGHTHQQSIDDGLGTARQVAGGVTANVAATDTLTTGTGAAVNTQSRTTGITMANAGSGSAHNNTQPVMGVNFIIKT